MVNESKELIPPLATPEIVPPPLQEPITPTETPAPLPEAWQEVGQTPETPELTESQPELGPVADPTLETAVGTEGHTPEIPEIAFEAAADAEADPTELALEGLSAMAHEQRAIHKPV
jgi:hypothetical protein